MKIVIRIIVVLVMLLIANHLVHAQWQGIEVSQVVEVGFRPSSINIAHTNDDAWSDIVLTPPSQEGFISVFVGQADGRFGTLKNSPREQNFTQTGTGDFDNDGIDDLAISSYWSNGFRLYHGQGDGKYEAGKLYQLSGHGKRVAVVDLNKDGASDVAAISGGSGQPITLHVFHGNNEGELQLKGTYTSALHTDTDITVTDKNGDGLVDLMITSSFPWFMIYYQATDGSFTPQYWPIQNRIELPYPRYELADLNNDKQPDIIALYPTTGSDNDGLKFFAGRGDTTFSEHPLWVSYQGINPSSLEVADLNNDGNLDLVLNHMLDVETHTDQLFYMLGKGDFSFEQPVAIRFPSAVVSFIVGNVNDDTYKDLVAYCDGGTIAVALNKNIVAGGPQEPVLPTTFPNPFIEKLNINATRYPAQISIYDTTGSIVGSAIISGETSFDASSWHSGVYIVKIQTPHDSSVTRVVRL